MNKPRKPLEVDSIPSIRNALIKKRDKALKENNFEETLLLCHAIAWLYYAIEAEKYIDKAP